MNFFDWLILAVALLAAVAFLLFIAWLIIETAREHRKEEVFNTLKREGRLAEWAEYRDTR